jgi:hypothetical protein
MYFQVRLKLYSMLLAIAVLGMVRYCGWISPHLIDI